MLEVRGVKKVYETAGVKRIALKDVSLNFRNSEFVAILGPSGSGKTTLLNIIGGLDHYTEGDLIIDGKSTKKFHDKDWDAYRNHRVGFVFQSYNLIPHQTVLQNVRLALTLTGISKRESVRRAKKALKDVGLAEHMDKRPAQLSGGQMQRVAIARALVNDPDIVLADEPTGALDSATSLQIMDLLQDIASKKLVVMVTHNPDLAREYATRIIKLKDGEITSDSQPYNNTKRSKETSGELPRARHRKTKMSYFTALSLSLRNLLTKKARTILVSIAGSIGIIGIALISAVSTGFQNYIDSIEKDTLTSYPLTLMEESADLTGVLLSIAGSGEGSAAQQTVKENQVLTGALGSVSHNDLESFMAYYEANKSQLGDSVRLIEREYNVDPVIYTVDQTGDLAKLNPSNLFTSLIGDTSLLSSYSSLTSVFQQHDLANLQEDSELVAGRWPERYDEMVLSLSNPSRIPDLMTYSLGFHDTDELNDILAKILNGETVTTDNEPLELTYDELMNVDLRLLPATATYRYNEKYEVYEDMSNDDAYMRDLYERASEPLKIVGIVTPKSDMSTMGNGVFYLPTLTEYIIEQSNQTEIVQQQLANPEIDIFSNTRFGEEKNDFDFEFSDLVSVDEKAIEQAFGVTISQDDVTQKTTEYIEGISGDIDDGAASVPTVRAVLTTRFESLAKDKKASIDDALQKFVQKLLPDPSTGSLPDADASGADVSDAVIEAFVMEQINQVDADMAGVSFADLEAKYTVPASVFKSAYTGFLKAYVATYIAQYMSAFQAQLTEYYDAVQQQYTNDVTTFFSKWMIYCNAIVNQSKNQEESNTVAELCTMLTASSTGSAGTGTGAGTGSGTGTTGTDPTALQQFFKAIETLSSKPYADYSLPKDLLDIPSPNLTTMPTFNPPEFSTTDFLAESESAEISKAFDTLAVTTAQIYLKQNILVKVGDLTSYLSSSFAEAFHLDQDALLGAFQLNFSEEELTRVVTAMFNEKESSLASNLSTLGYQALGEPTRIAFYFTSFDGKTAFMEFLDGYNDAMAAAGDEDKVIDYSDTTGMLMSSVKVIVDAVSYVLIAFVSISLVVSSIMIGVITYISVYERTKEIGILRAIGASKHNISSIFNAETIIIGFLAGMFGVVISYLLIPVINAVLHHFTGDIPLSAALAPTTAAVLVILSIVLTLIGGLIPAHSASKKDPVEALRSE